MVTGHGNDKYQYKNGILYDFSSNIPGGIEHEGLFRFLQKQLPSLSDYPNPTGAPLDDYIAQRLGVPTSSVCITNGATEGIYLTAQAFHGCRSAVLIPTFSEYADACRLHAHEVKSIFTLDSIPEQTQLIWLCNPNNPTGTILEKEYLLKQIEKHCDKIFVIDQSYECLTHHPLLQACEAVSYPNVVLLHSMTKEFAIPGLRLGYFTAHPLLLKRIASQRMPWSVNQLAIQAGCYLLAHEDEYALDLEGLLEERAYVAKELEKIGGMEVWPSQTHFLLVQLRFGKAPALKEYLAEEHRLLIRDCSNIEGLDDRFFRIAVQTPEANNLLLDAIEDWMKV